jgi:hypothetical protein
MKPTKLGEWAIAQANPAQDIIEPPQGLKNQGWLVGQRPPAQFWNWQEHNAYLWRKYLRDRVNLNQDIIITPVTGIDFPGREFLWDG